MKRYGSMRGRGSGAHPGKEERCATLGTTVTALQRHAEKKTKAKIQICRKPGFPESVTNKTV